MFKKLCLLGFSAIVLMLAHASYSAELQQRYMSYRGTVQSPSSPCFVTVTNKVENCLLLSYSNYLCTDPANGGTQHATWQVNIDWNFFTQNFGIQVPVYIYEVRGHIEDSTNGSNKYVTIQRASDLAFLFQLPADGVYTADAKNDFSGHEIKLDTHDSLLLESRCPTNNQRIFSASFFFTTTAP